MIRDLALTAEVVGFAPAPLYFLNIKGHGNFGVNLALTVEKNWFRGNDAVLEVLRTRARLTWTSMVFQASGLASAAYGFVSLAAATRPWASWAHWQR